MCLGVAVVTQPEKKGGKNQVDGADDAHEDCHIMHHIFAGFVGIANHRYTEDEEENNDGAQHLQEDVGEDDVVSVLQRIPKEVDAGLEDGGSDDEVGDGIVAVDDGVALFNACGGISAERGEWSCDNVFHQEAGRNILEDIPGQRSDTVFSSVGNDGEQCIDAVGSEQREEAHGKTAHEHEQRMPDEFLQIGGWQGQFVDAPLFVAQVVCPAAGKDGHHEDEECPFVDGGSVNPVEAFEGVGVNGHVGVVADHCVVKTVARNEAEQGDADGTCKGDECQTAIECLVDGKVIFCEVRKAILIEIHKFILLFVLWLMLE